MSFSTKAMLAGSTLLAAVLAVAAARPASSPAKVQPQTTVTLLRVPDGGIQPQVAVDAKGVIHLIYFKGDPAHGDIFYVRSGDGGATFSKPLSVNSKPGSAIAVGNIRGARLAIGSGGRIHVAWNGSRDAEPKGPLGAPMMYTRSNDSGTTFEPERNVIHTAWGIDGGGAVAADSAGDVYVLWHAPTPGQKGEENRRVWIARSTDGGKTFAAEKPAYDHPTGACGCCGLDAFADQHGSLYVLYRSATNVVNRDMYLLVSHNKGETFRGADISHWNVGYCVMSSESFADSLAGVLAAWETEKQVYYTRINPITAAISSLVAAPGATGVRKHPAVAGNAKGETLLAWTEGMGWNKGGSVAWQVFDRDSKPVGEKGQAPGVPVWSLVAAFPRADGGFTVVY